MKSYHLCRILLAKSKLQVTVQGRGLHRSVNARRQGSLRGILGSSPTVAMYSCCKDCTSTWVPPEPQMETQREAWEFLMHLCSQLIHLSLFLSKNFQLSNYLCTRSMSVSNTGSCTTHEPSLHLDTNVTLRSQSKRCGEAGHWGHGTESRVSPDLHEL